MNVADKAVNLFLAGYSCAQSVFVACCEEFGLDREWALKISRAFGGGMGGMGGTCGAATGAFMVIGLYYEADDTGAKERIYDKVQEFAARFQARNQAINCRDLLGCDPGTAAGKALIKEKKLRETLCVKFVRDAVEIVTEIMAQK